MGGKKDRNNSSIVFGSAEFSAGPLQYKTIATTTLSFDESHRCVACVRKHSIFMAKSPDSSTSLLFTGNTFLSVGTMTHSATVELTCRMQT